MIRFRDIRWFMLGGAITGFSGLISGDYALFWLACFVG